MKKLTIGLSVVALAMAGTAFAAPGQGGQARWGDADKNGTLTRAEAQTHATEMFARMDANKDGKLDTADREARRTAMFDKIDTNKDGQVSREEFSAKRPDGERRGDGRHRMGHRGGGKGWGGHGGGMMRMADANKDNAISQAEFTAAAQQRFDRTDANKDGQVTKEERQAARTAMREQRRAPAAAAPAQPAN
jgi:Ca2+-binding EF-hand superfamily protein